MKQRILITGASRGIGRAIAQKLAGPGIQLLLHGRDTARLEESARLCRAAQAEAQVLRFDLADSKQVEQLVAAVGSEPVSAVIHNAGVAIVKPFQELSLDEWNLVLSVNVTAPFLINKGLFANLRAGSSIVNILSVAARVGFPDWGSYCMSKFALDGFSQAMREELRGRGVRVINVIPAATDTELWNAVPGIWPREKMLPATEVADTIAFALSRRDGTLVEEIRVGGIGGNL